MGRRPSDTRGTRVLILTVIGLLVLSASAAIVGMMVEGDRELIAATQILFLIVFTLAILGGAITTTARLIRYLRLGESPPVILWRDVIARNSLAIPFLAIFAVRAARAMGYDVAWIVESIWWVLATSIPPTIGALIYVYFELYVIERGGNGYPGTSLDHAPSGEPPVEGDDATRA